MLKVVLNQQPNRTIMPLATWKYPSAFRLDLETIANSRIRIESGIEHRYPHRTGATSLDLYWTSLAFDRPGRGLSLLLSMMNREEANEATSNLRGRQ